MNEPPKEQWHSKTCPFCCKFYKSETSFKKHLASDGHGCTHYCCLCDEPFTKQRSYQQHLDSDRHLTRINGLDKSQTVFSCALCQHSYPTAEELNFHQDRGTTGCKHTCQHCLATFGSEMVRVDHEVNCDDNPDQEHKDNNCSVCHTHFNTKLEWARHQRGAANCQHSCRHCRSTLRDTDARKAHERVCALKPSNRLKCTLCPHDPFLTKSMFNAHLRMHLNRTCSTCGKTFDREHDLTKHWRKSPTCKTDTCASIGQAITSLNPTTTSTNMQAKHCFKLSFRAQRELHPTLLGFLKHLDLLEPAPNLFDDSELALDEFLCDTCQKYHAEGECEQDLHQRFCHRCGMFGHWQHECPLQACVTDDGQPMPVPRPPSPLHACPLCGRLNCGYHGPLSGHDHLASGEPAYSWRTHKGAFVAMSASQTSHVKPLRVPPSRQEQQQQPAPPWGMGQDHRTPCQVCGTKLYSFEQTRHRFCCGLKPDKKVPPPDKPPGWQRFLNDNPHILAEPRRYNHLCSPVAFATSKRDTTPNAEVRLHGRPYARVIPLESSRIKNTFERVSKVKMSNAHPDRMHPPRSTSMPASDSESEPDKDYQPADDDADLLLLAPDMTASVTAKRRPSKSLPTVGHTLIDIESSEKLPVYAVNNPARMYIYEGEFATMLDTQNQDDYKKTAIALQDELKLHCPWAKDLMKAKEVLTADNCKGGILIKQPSAAERGEHRTTSDAPAPNALAGLVFHDAHDVHERSSVCAPAVIMANTDQPPRFLERRSHVYEPLTYPLLYPMGTVGYSCLPACFQSDVTIGKPDDDSPARLDPYRSIKWHQYCRQRLCRDFVPYGRLAQEWAIDQFLIHEDLTLDFLASSKGQEKVAGYRFATAATQAQPGYKSTGKRLPTDFQGNPAHMRKLCKEAMAAVGAYGRPTFMITMTANEQWPEVVAGGGTFDVLCRVFEWKSKQLLSAIVKEEVLGPVDYYQWVTEYQKRGNPHKHLLVRLRYPPTLLSDVDAFVRGDLPDPSSEPELYHAVSSYMIHNPCSATPDAACRRGRADTKCRFHFPQPIQPQTNISELDGRCKYRRNAYQGRLKKNSINIDDRWVASYNPGLLLLFDGHVNVDYVTSDTAGKYIFKYVTKGCDLTHAMVHGRTDDDQIEAYRTVRWYGAHNVMDRIMGYRSLGRKPSVETLPFYEWEQEEEVVSNYDADDDDDADDSDSPRARIVTKLPAKLENYFDRPDVCADLTYSAFYSLYSNATGTKRHARHLRGKNGQWWTKRSAQHVAVLQFSPYHEQNEDFYLRQLLIHFPCRCKSDLLRLGSTPVTTYEEAARQLGTPTAPMITAFALVLPWRMSCASPTRLTSPPFQLTAWLPTRKPLVDSGSTAASDVVNVVALCKTPVERTRSMFSMMSRWMLKRTAMRRMRMLTTMSAMTTMTMSTRMMAMRMPMKLLVSNTD
eukprot:m.127284 g.127284  ORF g.127284 m.127284 type:complete len:1439 (+) comp15799_c0_seq8:229-4545(+)